MWCKSCWMVVLALLSAAGAAGAQGPSSAQVALESVFSPRVAPANRTMGLVQRNFLDLVESSHQKLQVALVVDATLSMEGELQGIREALGRMIDDLQRYKEENVSFQLVVFRDAGAASGEVTFPLDVADHGFTSDRQRLHEAVAAIQAESGAPYFHELIDLGIFKALTELPWSEGSDTTRWLLVFGDAPPFDEGFQEPDVKAARRIATDQLIATANRMGVKINCILCSSRAEDQAAYEKVLPKSREFMNRMATETGGLMLDMSYPDIRAALAKAAQVRQVTYQRIGPISREDIQKAREAAAAGQSPVSENRRTRIAVLPHMPLASLSFDPSLEGVQIAAELRHRFENIPGVEMKSPSTVERQVAILQARGVRGDQLIQALAASLRADYVVWGQVAHSGDTLEVRSAIYDGIAGKPVAQEAQRTQPQLPAGRLTAQLAMNMIRSVVSKNTDTRLVATFNNLQGGPAAQAAVVSPVARNPEARTDLLAGFETLQQALAYPAGDPQGDKKLADALALLERAVAPEADPSNPWAHALLASCHWNLAASAARNGNTSLHDEHRAQAEESLRRAYAFRDEAGFAYVKQEIEADYELLIKKDYAAAIKAYEALTGVSRDTPLHTALRAHWMLAGIYSGDWGIADDPQGKALTDVQKAREHLIQILAHWEDSSEAEFLRKNLRWDDVAGQTRFDYLPRVTQPSADRLAAGT